MFVEERERGGTEFQKVVARTLFEREDKDINNN